MLEIGRTPQSVRERRLRTLEFPKLITISCAAVVGEFGCAPSWGRVLFLGLNDHLQPERGFLARSRVTGKQFRGQAAN